MVRRFDSLELAVISRGKNGFLGFLGQLFSGFRLTICQNFGCKVEMCPNLEFSGQNCGNKIKICQNIGLF